MDINSRLLEFYNYIKKKQKITQQDFAENLGLDKTQLSKIFNGKDKAGLSVVEKFTNYYTDLNINWLVSGRGDMLISSGGTVSEPQSEYKKKPEENKQAWSTIDRNNTNIEKMIEISDRNSLSIQELVATNRMLVGMLMKEGYDIPSDYKIKKGATEGKNEPIPGKSYKSNAG